MSEDDSGSSGGGGSDEAPPLSEAGTHETYKEYDGDTETQSSDSDE